MIRIVVDVSVLIDLLREDEVFSIIVANVGIQLWKGWNRSLLLGRGIRGCCISDKGVEKNHSPGSTYSSMWLKRT